MLYISTRGHSEGVQSAEAIKKGLAPDGGLYVPQTIPAISQNEIDELCKCTYPVRSARILSKFLTDYTYEELLDASEKAYCKASFGDYPAPVVNVSDNLSVLELWHGPTCAFKDMALQIMPRLLSAALKKTNEHNTTLILVATSGDTGKAALEGYKDISGIKIIVFYPEDGVSSVQKLQMASQQGNNVCVCMINGNFDDAQTGVKSIFSDSDIAEKLLKSGYVLSSANSINWGRLAPQIVYYISAYCDLINSGKIKKNEKINVSVPTGNFGDILAAYYAKRMGLPIEKLICASNSNNVLTDFIKTGTYDRNRHFYTTMSPSMDILISSNLERLLYLVQGSEKTAECMKRLSESGKYTVCKETFDMISSEFDAGFATEAETSETIKSTFETYKYVADTHTAVGICAANKAGLKGVTLAVSTASPYKFAPDVLSALTGRKENRDDFFSCIDALEKITSTCSPAPIASLRKAEYRFKNACGRTKEDMWSEIKAFINK